MQVVFGKPQGTSFSEFTLSKYPSYHVHLYQAIEWGEYDQEMTEGQAPDLEDPPLKVMVLTQIHANKFESVVLRSDPNQTTVPSYTYSIIIP